jgi:4-hydroxy-tetrahydrodipicolinate synthase
MVTPFDAEGALDLDAAATLADWLVTNGSDGLVLCGTTGESPVLSESEEVALTRAVRQATSVPIILGTGSNDTAWAVAASRRSAELGVDGLLVVTPYYNRPPQYGMEAHFRQIAAATELPILLYDIPVRTGRHLAQDTMLRLFDDVPNIVGLKDASGNPAQTARLIARADRRIDVYSGDDAYTLPLLSVGAKGVISVASHWVGRQMGEMIAAFQKGDVAAATRINAGLIPSYDFEGGDDSPNPIPTKAMLRVLGLPVGQCRMPLGPAPDWVEERARDILKGLN